MAGMRHIMIWIKKLIEKSPDNYRVIIIAVMAHQK